MEESSSGDAPETHTSNQGGVTKSSKPPLEQMSQEDLIKQVKRQLILLQKTKAKCDELSGRCTDLEKQRDGAIQERAHLQESLGSEIREFKSKISQLSSEKHEAEIACRSIKEMQETQFQQFQELEAKFNSLCTECHRLESELQISQDETVTLRRRCHTAEEQSECLEMKLETLTSTCKCLQDEITKLQEERKDLKDQVTVLTEARDSAMEAVALLKIKTQASDGGLEDLSQENSSLRQQLKETAHRLEIVSKEKNDLEKSYAEIDKIANEVKKSLQSALEDCESWKLRCEVHENEKIPALETQLSEMSDQMRSLEEILESNHASEKELKQSLQKVLEDKESYRLKCEGYEKDQIPSLESRLSETNEQLRMLEKTLLTKNEMDNDYRDRLQRALDDCESWKLRCEMYENEKVPALERQLDEKEQKLRTFEKMLQTKDLADVNLKENLQRAVNECESWKLKCEMYEKEKIPQFEGQLEDLQNKLKSLEKTLKNKETAEQEQQAILSLVESKLETALKEVQDKDVLLKCMNEEHANLVNRISLLESQEGNLANQLSDSLSKVLELEGQLNEAVQQKRELLDELVHTKESERFMEEESKHQKKEREKIKIQVCGLEADLENDRLHISKLENELVEAEAREKVLQAELEKLKEASLSHSLHSAPVSTDSENTPGGSTKSELEEMQKWFNENKELLRQTVIKLKQHLQEAKSFETSKDNLETRDENQNSQESMSAETDGSAAKVLQSMLDMFSTCESVNDLLEKLLDQIKASAVNESISLEHTLQNHDAIELSKRLTQLQEERDSLLAEKSLMLGQIEGMTTTIDQLQLHISQQQVETSAPNRSAQDKSSFEKHNVELLEKVKLLEENLAEKTMMIDKIHCRLDDLLTRNEELMSEMDEKEKDLEEAEKAICELESSVTCLKMEVTSKNALVTYLESSLASLKDGNMEKNGFETNEKADELSELYDKVTSLEGVVTEKQLEISTLLQTLEQRVEEVKLLKDQLLEQSRLLEVETEEKLKVKNECLEINLQLSKASEKIRTLENEMGSTLENYTTLQKENKSLKQEIQEMRNQGIQQNKEMETLKTALKTIQIEKETVEKDLDQSNASLIEMNDQLHGLATQLQDKIAEVNVLQVQLEKLKESHEILKAEGEKQLAAAKEENKELWQKLKNQEELHVSKSIAIVENAKQTTGTDAGEASEIIKLQNCLKETEERMNKFKIVAVKVKKELAETRKHLSDVSDERTKLRCDVEHLSSACRQHLHNLQALQTEYDKLQDDHEALKATHKQMESDLIKVVSELGEARKQLSELKEAIETCNSEKKAAEQLRSELEGKIIILESDKLKQQDQIEQIKGTLVKTESHTRDLEDRLQKEQEKHSLTVQQLNQALKEAQQHSVLDLEMADYERTVSDMTTQLEGKQKDIEELQQQVLKTKERVASLQVEIEHLDRQRSTEEDRANNLKQLLVKAKDELSVSRNREQELQKSLSLTQSQVELLASQAEQYKLQLTEYMSSKEQLSQSLRSCRDTHQKATRMLESKISSLQEELQTCRVELESKSAEFENYKVRVCNVLKQQRKPEPLQDLVHKETIEKQQKTIEQLRTRMQELTDQLQASTAENDALHDDHNRLLQRHTKIIEELHAKDHLWSERLEGVTKEKTALSVEINDLKQQLYKQQEIVSNTFKQLHSAKESHQQTVGLLQKQLDAADKEIVRLQKEVQRGGSVPFSTQQQMQEDAMPFDVFTQERQEGEGSECTNTGSATPVKAHLSFSTIPTGGFVPFEQLVQSAEEPGTPASISSHQDIESLTSSLLAAHKKIEHLNELLNESEANNLRLSEQTRLLKEEIRRLERNKEREKHAENLEYMKNVVIKFITLKGSDERERLIPVLTTMLRLSPEEQRKLQELTESDSSNGNPPEGWGSYLHRWSGIA